MSMKTGKISQAQLKRSVLKQLHKDETCLGPAPGMDFCAFPVEEGQNVVLSTNPLTGTLSEIGRRAVYHVMNDVATSGGTGVGILVNVMLPTSANEAQLREFMRDIDVLAKELGIAVLGGHTEVTRAVKEPVITLTGVGKVAKDKMITSAGARPGMDILLTNWIGLEGTAILAEEKEDSLRTRYSTPFLDKAKAFESYLDISKAAAIAAEAGVAAMHNLSTGGVYGALWEMAEASGIGLELDLKKIPVKQETIEICEFFDINPYKLLSGGSLLMAAEDGNQVLRQLEQAGIPAVIIGKATAGNDRVLLFDEERRFLETPQKDEIIDLRE